MNWHMMPLRRRYVMSIDFYEVKMLFVQTSQRSCFHLLGEMHSLYLFLFFPCVFLPSAVFSLMLALSAGPLYRLAIKSPIFAAGHFSLSQHSPPPPPLYLIISSEKANDPLRDREQEEEERESVREGCMDGARYCLSL